MGTGFAKRRICGLVWTHQCCTTCRSACRFLVDCLADPLVDLCVDLNVDLHVELVASPTEDLFLQTSDTALLKGVID